MLEWWKPIAIILMLPAALLVVIGLATPNPTSVGQEGRVGQPPQGIVRVTRHPFLTVVGLWALVHLIGNGDIASLVFFATRAIVALAGTVSIDAKRRRLLAGAWEPFAAQTPRLFRLRPSLRGGIGSSLARSGCGTGPSRSSPMC